MTTSSGCPLSWSKMSVSSLRCLAGMLGNIPGLALSILKPITQRSARSMNVGNADGYVTWVTEISANLLKIWN